MAQASAGTGISANRLELLQIADAVAREKSIDRKIVIQAMEDAIQKAGQIPLWQRNDIRCEIDPKTGETKLARVLLVVEVVENDATQITLTDAKRRKPSGDRRSHCRDACRRWTTAACLHRRQAGHRCRRCERQSASGQHGEYKDRIGEDRHTAPGEAGRIRQRDCRSWPRRGHHSGATK